MAAGMFPAAGTSYIGDPRNPLFPDPKASPGEFIHDTLKGQQQFGYQKELAAAQQASQRDIAYRQAAASELPAQLQQQRWQQMFPFMQQKFNYLSNALLGPNGVMRNQQQGGGPSGNFGGGGPTISAAPVFTPNQIQADVNTMRATNDQSTAGQVRDMQQRLGGRGMGAGSPLSQALTGMFTGQNLQANTAGETEKRLSSAQANAKQVLAGQTAQEQQFASRQQEQIARETAARQQQTALFSALAGMLNG